MYVSDIIETIFNAGHARAAVRTHLMADFGSLPPALRPQVLPIAHYICGKCMGYPAIWFSQRLLGEMDHEVAELAKLAQPALFLSLTTSIVDDLLDGDEKIGAEHLLVLYRLFNRALSDDGWPSPQVAMRSEARLDAVAADFLDIANDTADRDTRRGRRIGHFHRSIADCIAVNTGMTEERREAFVELVGRFGDWCAHLDDALDFEQDAHNGGTDSYAVRVWLVQRAAAPSQKKPSVIRTITANTLAAWLTDGLEELSRQVRDFPAQEFADELSLCHGRLERILTQSFSGEGQSNKPQQQRCPISAQ